MEPVAPSVPMQASGSRRAPPRPPGLMPVYAAGVGAVLAVFLARAMVDGRILYPGCGFRWVTGRPCPGCGGTHALSALAEGETSAAFASNPLVALLALALAGLALLAAVDRGINRGRGVAGFLGRLPRARGARWWIAGAVLANWCYLLFALE